MGMCRTRIAILMVFVLTDPLIFPLGAQLTYSTGAINNYGGNGDLQQRLSVAAAFQFVYNHKGFRLLTSWTCGNVWASDFIDQSSPNDMAPSEGSHTPNVYLFVEHGTCE